MVAKCCDCTVKIIAKINNITVVAKIVTTMKSSDLDKINYVFNFFG